MVVGRDPADTCTWFRLDIHTHARTQVLEKIQEMGGRIRQAHNKPLQRVAFLPGGTRGVEFGGGGVDSGLDQTRFPLATRAGEEEEIKKVQATKKNAHVHAKRREGLVVQYGRRTTLFVSLAFASPPPPTALSYTPARSGIRADVEGRRRKRAREYTYTTPYGE